MARDILIVDDEADIRMLIAGVLGDEGFTTREAANSDEALSHLRQRCPNLIVLDIWLQNSALDGIPISSSSTSGCRTARSTACSCWSRSRKAIPTCRWS